MSLSIRDSEPIKLIEAVFTIVRTAFFRKNSSELICGKELKTVVNCGIMPLLIVLILYRRIYDGQTEEERHISECLYRDSNL